MRDLDCSLLILLWKIVTLVLNTESPMLTFFAPFIISLFSYSDTTWKLLFLPPLYFCVRFLDQKLLKVNFLKVQWEK